MRLADSALDIFGNEDGKELTVIVRASAQGVGLQALSTAAIYYFRSQPRAIDGGELIVTIGDFRRGAIVLPSHLVKAKILHAEESYSLIGHRGLFAANPVDGAISLTSNIYAAGEWTVILRATSESASVVAEQTIVFKAAEESFRFEIAGAGSTILINANAPSGSAVATIMVDGGGAGQNGVSVFYSTQSPYFTISEKRRGAAGEFRA